MLFIYVEKTLIYRHMRFDPKAPFDALPRLPPKGDLENKVVLKACVEARAALVQHHPVARGSGKFDNRERRYDDGCTRLAQLQENGADPQTKEALRYRTAIGGRRL